MGPCRRLVWILLSQLVLAPAICAAPAEAAERLCDPAFENCRGPLVTLIRGERVGIDVAFWFMTDTRYADELILRHKAGVKVRVLADLRANAGQPGNATILERLKAAGIPIRHCVQSGILHWKLMLFAGQNTVQFSGANYSSSAFSPISPYRDYVDEAIFFSDERKVVDSFKRAYDRRWTDESRFRDWANVRRPLARHYGDPPDDPEMSWPPYHNFATASVERYRAEASAIDAIMYRITDRRHSDAMIAAVRRGVRVRLITEPHQYRDPNRYWHSWNVDRMYMGGVKIRHRKHSGLMHQKTTLLYSQGLTIFGSSNWTSPSASSQIEHNYFTRKLWFFQWFLNQFNRKWGNLAGYAETTPFVPLAPSAPAYVSPANGAAGQPTKGLTLKWKPGYWAHKADIYFGTSSNPPLYKRDVAVKPTTTASVTLPTLSSGRRYYWKIVSKTMADKTAEGRVYSFKTP